MEPIQAQTRRAILAFTRIRFAPEVQPIRDAAIDRIVQGLLLASPDTGLTISEIQDKLASILTEGRFQLLLSDIRLSIGRLREAKRVFRPDRQRKRYTLSSEAIEELSEEQRAAERRFKKVVDSLFADAPGGSEQYAEPFLQCLCYIFSRLADVYIQQMAGQMPAPVDSRVVSQAAAEAYDLDPTLDRSAFEMGILRFFNDPDPDYDLVKWVLAQNYYLIKALGVDSRGALLSRELFGDAEFYLDTNVAISALEPSTQHHRSFRVLSQACHQLGITLRVAQITIDELRAVVQYYKSYLPRVLEVIPDGTLPHVRGEFVDLFLEKRARAESISIDEVFEGFETPAKSLSEKFGVVLVDDKWFIEAETALATAKLVRSIQTRYHQMRRRPKKERAARHDALLLRWMEQLRSEAGAPATIVTLDTTLPTILGTDQPAQKVPLCLTLEALLQWISPIAISEAGENEVAAIFADAVRSHVLPQDKFLTLQDFLVFVELEVSCKDLPAEDVEGCIRYLRAHAADLDLGNPRDRERLAHEIKKFLVSPDRKHLIQVSQLEGRIANLNDTITRLQGTVDKRYEKLNEEFQGYRAASEKDKLRGSARSRAVVALIVFACVESLCIKLAITYGDGLNWLQRLGNLWFLPSAGAAVSFVSAWFIVGKERLQLLGWPFSKLAKE